MLRDIRGREGSRLCNARRAIFRAILGGAGATLLLEVLIMASMSGGSADAARGARGACFAAVLCGGGAIGYAYLLTRVCGHGACHGLRQGWGQGHDAGLWSLTIIARA